MRETGMETMRADIEAIMKQYRDQVGFAGHIQAALFREFISKLDKVLKDNPS